MSIMDAINTQQIHDHAADGCLACTTPPRPGMYTTNTQSTKIVPRRRFRVRWAQVASAALVAACTVAVVAMLLVTADKMAGDPAVSVPACTDEIADAGGICIGEPE